MHAELALFTLMKSTGFNLFLLHQIFLISFKNEVQSKKSGRQEEGKKSNSRVVSSNASSIPNILATTIRGIDIIRFTKSLAGDRIRTPLQELGQDHLIDLKGSRSG